MVPSIVLFSCTVESFYCSPQRGISGLGKVNLKKQSTIQTELLHYIDPRSAVDVDPDVILSRDWLWATGDLAHDLHAELKIPAITKSLNSLYVRISKVNAKVVLAVSRRGGRL